MPLSKGAEDLAVRVWDPRSGALRAVQTFKGYVYFPVRMRSCLAGANQSRLTALLLLTQLGIDVSADGNYILTSSKGFNSVGCELRVRFALSNVYTVKVNLAARALATCVGVGPPCGQTPAPVHRPQAGRGFMRISVRWWQWASLRVSQQGHDPSSVGPEQ